MSRRHWIPAMPGASTEKELHKNARQGVTGHNVGYVLAISLGTAELSLVILVIAFVT